jgi:DNA-binding MarR family transcriptional regulator
VVAAWRALLVAHRTLTLAMDADLRTESGLSLEEYDILVQLSEAGGSLPMTALARAVLVAPSSCTRLVGQLEARGLVERARDAEDRRVVRASLTPSGRRAQRRAALVHLRGIDELVGSRLSSAEAEALTGVLLRLGGRAGARSRA